MTFVFLSNTFSLSAQERRIRGLPPSREAAWRIGRDCLVRLRDGAERMRTLLAIAFTVALLAPTLTHLLNRIFD